jgi:sphingomyelin phosphodiesterase
MQKKVAPQSFSPYQNNSIDTPSPQASILSENGNSLKIISWNIFMLPSFVMRTGQSKRAHQIVHVLKEEDADIIVFQEAFDSTAREIIRKGLSSYFPYESGDPPKNIVWKTNSGLWIISKIPFMVVKNMYFQNGKGPDWFACKGAMLIQSEKNGFAFQLVATHLQSDFGGKESQKIRMLQCEQIRKELLEPYAEKGVPQLLAGDFNTIHHESEKYEQILNILRAKQFSLHGEHTFSYDHTVNDLIKGIKDKPQLIDYILYTCNEHHKEHPKLDARMFINVFRKQWHQKFHDLSDHFAIAGVFQFS